MSQLLYHNYYQCLVCCDDVALYSNMGDALRQFVLYWNTLGIGLSFINTAVAYNNNILTDSEIHKFINSEFRNYR